MDINLITMEDFFDDNGMLELKYVDFDTKLEIALTVITTLINNNGYINSSLLRRFAIESIINTITNIDMAAECTNGLTGFDYMCFIKDGFEILHDYISQEYDQFMEIIMEQANDYNQGRWVLKNEA